MKRKDESTDELEKRLMFLSKSFHRIRNSLLEEADSLYFQQKNYQKFLKRCLNGLEIIVSADYSVQRESLQRQISAEIDFYERENERFEKSCHAFFKQETFREDKPINKLLDKKIIFARSILGNKILHYFPRLYREVLSKESNVNTPRDVLPLPTTLLMFGTLSTILVFEEVVDTLKSNKKKTKEKILSIEKNIIELESMILEIQDRRITTGKKENSIMRIHASLQSLTISSLSRSDIESMLDETLLRHMEYASSILETFPLAGKTE